MPRLNSTQKCHITETTSRSCAGTCLSLVQRVNVPRMIASHLIGKRHSTAHHMAVGLAVMMAGVGIAHLGSAVESFFIRVWLDIVGWGIHGLGLTPYLESVISAFAEVE